MTAIAGLVHRGVVYMGGDSAVVSGLDLTVRAAPKVFRVGPMALGWAWGPRPAQLLIHAFRLPPLPKRRGELMRYMVTDFVDALRALHRAHGWIQSNNGRDSSDSHLLAGVWGRLFRIEGDYQVGEARDGFDGIGCGGTFVLGALYATRSVKNLKPEARVRLALAAAERHSAGVRGPFALVTTQ